MSALRRLIALLLVMVWAAGCGRPGPAATPANFPVITPAGEATAAAEATAVAPEEPPVSGGLSPDEIATLNSLEQVDDYPLYTMHYQGAYTPWASGAAGSTLRAAGARAPAWGCSLFAALNDTDQVLYGRNFDWEFSPALLLFTAPPDGYASVAMVDIAFLGFDGSRAGGLAGLPPDERRALLLSPYLPFDGMNEHGLVVGMAAVPPGDMRPDPHKETIGSLGIIREMLDHARTVDEAVALLERYNVDMTGGPPVHYLIADRTSRAVLVEFYQGEMVVIANDRPWHLATNFLRSSAGDSPAGQCWRYDEIAGQLAQAQGQLTAAQAMDLLGSVAQPNTQWSVVYELATGRLQVAMGQRYGQAHTFALTP